MTVKELLHRIESKELSEWAAFEALTGPIGGQRSDFNAATIAATIAEANRNEKAKRTPFTEADFMPDWGKEEEEETSEEKVKRQMNVFKRMAMAMRANAGGEHRGK